MEIALPQLKGGDSRTVAVLPLTADEVLEVDRVAAVIAGGTGAAHAIVEANKHGVNSAPTALRETTRTNCRSGPEMIAVCLPTGSVGRADARRLG